MDITNPIHLIYETLVPAGISAVASQWMGTYQPNPAIPARRFKPLTVAIYSGFSNLLTRLSFDGLYRIGQVVTPESIKPIGEVIGNKTVALLAMGGCIAGIALLHIIPRDTAKSITGESVDWTTGVNFNTFTTIVRTII